MISAILATPAAFVATPASAEMSGNVSAVSKYIFRGITEAPEDDNGAVQGGFDYAHESGLYAGYWGSTLSYGDTAGSNGFENDLYFGFGGEMGDISYDVGVLFYEYLQVENADTAEAYASVGYGPFSVGFAYMTDDASWANKGDVAWTIGYETELPKGFGLGVTAYYVDYDQDDASNPYANLGTTESSNLQGIDFALSHDIGETGAGMTLTYHMGGKDRGNTEQSDAVTIGLSYDFDIK